MKKNTLTYLMVLLFLLLTGCADTIPIAHGVSKVGFWHGLWHGMILPFSFLVSIFDSSTAIYAVYNNGGWYDFGFFVGIGSLAGGSSTTVNR